MRPTGARAASSRAPGGRLHDGRGHGRPRAIDIGARCVGVAGAAFGVGDEQGREGRVAIGKRRATGIAGLVVVLPGGFVDGKPGGVGLARGNEGVTGGEEGIPGCDVGPMGSVVGIAGGEVGCPLREKAPAASEGRVRLLRKVVHISFRHVCLTPIAGGPAASLRHHDLAGELPDLTGCVEQESILLGGE